MSLKQIVDFMSEGTIVHLFNQDGKKIYRLESITPTNVKICDVSSPFGNLLDEDEWPWYIKSHFRHDLVELMEIPADLLDTLPIEHYTQKKPSDGE